MKKSVFVLLTILVMSLMLVGCGGSGSEESDSSASSAASSSSSAAVSSAGEEEAEPGLEDGSYIVDFVTDSSMFKINDAHNGKAVLTVKDGSMTVHISLQSKKIVNLFPGTAADAEKEGAALLEPTTDHVRYSDGYEEDVNGFDVPVPQLDEDFDLALVGTKGKWYDHKVSVSNPVPGDDVEAAASGTPIELEDGEYMINIAMTGGSGKASVESPAKMTVAGGEAVMTVTWSSPNYDYMLVEGNRYEPVNEEGNSVFEIPVSTLDAPFTVIADTVAMSQPHEIEYQFTCSLAE